MTGRTHGRHLKLPIQLGHPEQGQGWPNSHEWVHPHPRRHHAPPWATKATMFPAPWCAPAYRLFLEVLLFRPFRPAPPCLRVALHLHTFSGKATLSIGWLFGSLAEYKYSTRAQPVRPGGSFRACTWLPAIASKECILCERLHFQSRLLAYVHCLVANSNTTTSHTLPPVSSFEPARNRTLCWDLLLPGKV